MPPEFFRPAGPERRSRPEFEQRLYQTAISAKLSAEWQTGPGISPRKAGCKVLFCQKRRGDQAAEGGGFFEERQTDGTAAERHGKQLPQTCRPGFRGYKSRGPDRTATERGAAAGDGVQATDNKRQALDDGRRNGRRTTGGEGMDGDGRRWTAGGRSKEWRKKNQTEYRRRRTDRQSWRAAGRESYRRRELRAERATGRQEENVRQEGRRNKGRCNEDRQDCRVRRQKNRPAQPQARRHGPKAGIQYLFLLAQNTHRNVENRRIVQRNHASVRPRLEVDTHAFFRLVLASEIVTDGVYINS